MNNVNNAILIYGKLDELKSKFNRSKILLQQKYPGVSIHPYILTDHKNIDDIIRGTGWSTVFHSSELNVESIHLATSNVYSKLLVISIDLTSGELVYDFDNQLSLYSYESSTDFILDWDNVTGCKVFPTRFNNLVTLINNQIQFDINNRGIMDINILYTNYIKDWLTYNPLSETNRLIKMHLVDLLSKGYYFSNI